MKKLGRGGFGQVSQLGGLAVKKIMLSDETYKYVTFITEATVCEYLKDIYTISCLDYNIRESQFGMQLGQDTLKYRDYLISTGNLSALNGLISALQESVNYIHSMGLLHGDIKPHNTIYHDDRLKLIDFGFCRYLGNELIPKNGRYTYGYRPFELFLGPAAVHRSLDIWATGVSIYKIITGHDLFYQEDFDDEDMTFAITNFFNTKHNIFKNTPLAPPDQNYYNLLVRNMLSEDPTKRTLMHIEGDIEIPLKLVPLEIPNKEIKLDDLPLMEKGLIIGYLLNLSKLYKLEFHTFFLTMRIIYMTYANFLQENFQKFALSAFRLSLVLIGSPQTLDFFYNPQDKTLQKFSNSNDLIDRILDVTFQVRANDEYLYLLEKLVSNDTRDDQLQNLANQLFILMMMNPRLLSYEPGQVFETFYKLYKGQELLENQKDIRGDIKSTFDIYRSIEQYIPENTFSSEFIKLF